MALLDHREDFLPSEDYRAYLVKQNQAPIVHHTENRHLKRTVRLFRAAVSKVGSWSTSLYIVIRNAKFRRIQREFLWHGIPYSYLLEDDGQAKSSDAARGGSRNLP